MSHQLRQKLYNRVCNHLIAQGTPSFRASTGPAYRGCFGQKCAIGVLIDDEHYDKDLEGKTADHLHVGDALRASGWPLDDPATRDLIKRLQFLHDKDPIEMWRGRLEDIGHYHGLKIPDSICTTRLTPKRSKR